MRSPRILALVALLFGLALFGFWKFGVRAPAPIERATEPEVVEAQAPAESLTAPAAQLRGEVRTPVNDAQLESTTPVAGAPAEGTRNVPIQAAIEASGEPPLVLIAHLVDFLGNPVAQRSITLELKLGGAGGSTMRMEQSTDANGEFRQTFDSWTMQFVDLAFVDSGRGAKVRVSAVVLPASGEVDLGKLVLVEPRELYPVPLLTGRVLGDGGETIPGLQGAIGASQWDEGAKEAWPEGVEGQVVFREDGAFEAFGPQGVSSVDLSLLAPNYEVETLTQLAVPRVDLEVRMARTLRWSGKLVVPEGGPPATEYGVWINQTGGGFGISPGEDGSFLAYGTTRALNLKVSYPSLGTVLFEKEFVLAQATNGALGEVDLRDLLKWRHLQALDAEGNPLANESFEFGGEGFTTILGRLETDASGHFWMVIPSNATKVWFGSDPAKQSSFEWTQLPETIVLR